MQDCPGCQKFHFQKKIWCEACLEKIETIGNMSERIRTLYNYNDPLKSCLVLYKAFGSRYHRQSLIEALEIKSNDWQDLVEWCEYIAPAPQSLKSWLSGKYNVAELMMEQMIKVKRRKKLFLPVKITFQKQSNKKRSNVHEHLITAINPRHMSDPINKIHDEPTPVKQANSNLLNKVMTSTICKIWNTDLTNTAPRGCNELLSSSMTEMGKKILIVDDVLTSGHTLLSILKENIGHEFKILTLCRSRAMDFKTPNLQSEHVKRTC